MKATQKVLKGALFFNKIKEEDNHEDAAAYDDDNNKTAYK